MANTRKNIVILGAGPGGLCAAWNLAQDGHNVIVLEKEKVCGGLSITFKRGDYLYDLGPHNLHPKRASVRDFLKTNLGDQLFQHNFKAKIYFRGKWVRYPLVGADVITALNPWTALHCGGSFLKTRLLSYFLPQYKDNGSFERWVKNRFGRNFYSIYFGPYCTKVWNIPPSELSDIVAKKRIVVKGIFELIHGVIFKQQHYHPENPNIMKNFYPHYGIGTVCDYFEKGILKHGGKIIRSATVKKLTYSKNQITKVHYTASGKLETMEFPDKKMQVISTVPINDMITMLEGTVPQNVTGAAKGLDFVAQVLLYININKPKVFDTPVTYFSEAEFPFNRIYDIGIFSPKMVPQGKTALCLEITCNVGDDMWQAADDKELFERCLEPLEKRGILTREMVDDYHTKRIPNAYPRFRVGYEKRVNVIYDFIDNKVSNLFSYGRQGGFSYSNVDDVIWMGFEVAKQVNYNNRITLPIKELLPDYVDF